MDQLFKTEESSLGYLLETAVPNQEVLVMEIEVDIDSLIKEGAVYLSKRMQQGFVEVSYRKLDKSEQTLFDQAKTKESPNQSF